MKNLRDKLFTAFARERAEHLGSIRELLTSRSPDSEELLRRAHTLKGAALAVGWSAGERLAHCLESAFQKALDGEGLALVEETLGLLEHDDAQPAIVLERWRIRFGQPAPTRPSPDFFWEVHGGGRLYLLPSRPVERILQVESASLQTWRGWPRLLIDGRRVSALPLNQLLSQPALPARSSRWPALLVRYRGRRLIVLLESFPRRCRQAGASELLSPAALFQAYRTGLLTPTRFEAGRGGRILVVDDSLTTQTLQREILEAHGYRVQLASDGLEACRLLTEQTFDLILTDLQMPRLDGFTLLRHLKSQALLRQIPVVLVSSLENPHHPEAQGYLNKRTFSQAELLLTVGRLLSPGKP